MMTWIRMVAEVEITCLIQGKGLEPVFFSSVTQWLKKKEVLIPTKTHNPNSFNQFDFADMESNILQATPK